MTQTTAEIIDMWKKVIEEQKRQEAIMLDMLMSRGDVPDETLLEVAKSYRRTLAMIRDKAPKVYDRLAGRINPTTLMILFPRKFMP